MQNMTKNLLTAALATTFAASSAQAALVAHWDFDEGTGTTVTDSESGNVGTLSSGVTFSSTFAPAIGSGTSVSFSTANNQIVVPDSASLSITSDISIAVWVNPIDVEGAMARNIVAKDANNAQVLVDNRLKYFTPAGSRRLCPGAITCSVVRFIPHVVVCAMASSWM